MYIILIAHIPGNKWTLWIPARFGFSDATEIFVFCSGMASAIAFGGVFARAGWAMGALRILHRMWQVYWAHIGVFFTILLSMVLLNATGLFEKDYIGSLNLYPFVNQTAENLLGLMTLTYVPNYFDILPMYLVILGMIPFAMALARIHPALVIASSITLWLYANQGGTNLPAELWFENGSTRQWFFNPFAWQLVFFTGFGFMAGWYPAPPKRRDLIALAAVVVIVTVPFAWYKIIGASPFVREWRSDWAIHINKTQFGVLRYVHFLSVAYLAWVWAGPMGARLNGSATKERVIGVIRKVGQQSLAVFMTSMVLARWLGVLFDVYGNGPVQAALVNLFGAAIITGTAYFVAYLKSQPWRKPVERKPAPTVDHAQPIVQVQQR